MTDFDDRHVDGDRYDATKFMVDPWGDRWFGFDRLGNEIHEAATEDAARQWLRKLVAKAQPR